MSLPFFSRRVPFVPLVRNVAMLSLIAVLIALPMMYRGARFGLAEMKNDVKDWLPADFPETKELDWFRKHFLGEQFVLVSWPGAVPGAAKFEKLVEKLEAEAEDSATMREKTDVNGSYERARSIGKEHGLHYVGDVYFNWGGKQEKWLQGFKNQWYYITPHGDLYRWMGQDSLFGWMGRSGKRLFTSKKVHGELVASFPSTNEGVSPFYDDPRLVTARLFKTVMTGPKVVDQLAGPEGWVRREAEGYSELEKAQRARQIAMSRLDGAMFGPSPPADFDWTIKGLDRVVPQDLRDRFPVHWKNVAERFLARTLKEYDGDLQKLALEGRKKRAQLWEAMFREISPDPHLIELPEMFDWTAAGLAQHASAEVLEKLPRDWKHRLNQYVSDVVRREYGGDKTRLAEAPYEEQEERWLGLFDAFRITPPQQTCIILTLSEVGRENLRWVVGRPLMGKPRGRLLDLAAGECGIELDQLNLGGPAVDNVAIDEEGQITLVRLIGYSAVIGLALAWLAFRSVKVTIMVFFVGLNAAVASLAAVWWTGQTVDAVLLSMPSLVYVLGLSGAIHILNYYRDAANDHGLLGAPERALSHGWKPCTLAAFTTAIGLLSLYTSNVIPIRKFGLYSALAVVGTLLMLFAYLPSVLTLWPVDFRRRTKGKEGSQRTSTNSTKLEQIIHGFWERIGAFVIRRHALVAVVCLIVLVGLGLGLTRINTSIQLLKLFDPSAKIIQDYTSLEHRFAKLVPMEVVLRFDEQTTAPIDQPSDERSKFGLNLLERMEAAQRVHQTIEREFGPDGTDEVGRALSAPTFAAELPGNLSEAGFSRRTVWNRKLEENRERLFDSGYYRIDQRNHAELWRISVRLGALDNVDYGDFVGQFKKAVEPVLSAYHHREEILREIDKRRGGKGFAGQQVLMLGQIPSDSIALKPNTGDSSAGAEDVNQTRIFADTLSELLDNANLVVHHHRPDGVDRSEEWREQLQSYASVIVVGNSQQYDWKLIRESARMVIEARDHQFGGGDQKTARQLDENISAVYTGLVPIVYRAQRTLLNSLIKSIGWAFVLIALVMMVLLRDWKRRWAVSTALNARAGAISMIPNVFPVVIVFGVMGWKRIPVDIGSMMTASVAMGVAVDDTIHFLTWFRKGIAAGLPRRDAILQSYRRVAMAMTQTTLIGGLGLSVFALSTFTPTQRFGVLMLSLLACALVGDLILLPALLAGPLGRFFAPKTEQVKQDGSAAEESGALDQNPPSTPLDGNDRPPSIHGVSNNAKGKNTIHIHGSHAADRRNRTDGSLAPKH